MLINAIAFFLFFAISTKENSGWAYILALRRQYLLFPKFLEYIPRCLQRRMRRYFHPTWVWDLFKSPWYYDWLAIQNLILALRQQVSQAQARHNHLCCYNLWTANLLTWLWNWHNFWSCSHFSSWKCFELKGVCPCWPSYGCIFLYCVMLLFLLPA